MMRALATLCALLCLPVSAAALSLRRPSFSTLVQRSAWIVRAEVIGQKVVARKNGLPMTQTRFRILHTHKGTSKTTLTLQLPGGSVGKYRLQVPGVPRFRMGAKLYLFVRAYRHSRFPVLVALSYGIFDIRKSGKVSNRNNLLSPMSQKRFLALLKKHLKAPSSRPARGKTSS